MIKQPGYVILFVVSAVVLSGCAPPRHGARSAESLPPPPQVQAADAGAPEIEAAGDEGGGEARISKPAEDAVRENEADSPPSVLAYVPLSEGPALPEPEAQGGEGEEGEGCAPASSTDPRDKYQAILDTALELCKSAQELWRAGSPEGALNSLDEAYELILKVPTDHDPELVQQKEDLRFLIAKRILEIHASRQTGTHGNHNEIPVTLNREVLAEIQRFQGPERSFFLASYKRSGRYRPAIVKALKEAGLPEELSWLPLIESGFKTRALSRARALGLWQFIPSTGYKYGLNRNTWVDERLDPEKATRAAIQYLQELHSIFGDWLTVLAAYNCGEGTVLRVIREQKVDYLDHFWDLYERLPIETARYVPRFLAVLQILKDPEKYGFKLPEPDPPLQYDTVEVTKQLHLKQISRVLGVDLAELKELNPELRYSITPPKGYEVKVPPGKGELLAAKLDELKPWTMGHKTYVWHRVRRGETLSSIAARYRSRVKDIVLANRLRHKNLIRVGQKLRIPVGTRGGRGVYAALSPEECAPGTGRRHVVRRGETLWEIARRYRVSVRRLKRANGLRSSRLRIGQVLRIPD